MTTVMNGGMYEGGRAEYSAFAKLMHWTIAFCVLAMIPMGFAMTRVPSGLLQNGLFTLHRSFGVLVAVLMLIRLGYRLFAGVPAPEPSLPGWQRIVSHLVHLGLYVLLIAQPIIGWVATSAYGAEISVFGAFTLPPIVAKDQELSKPLFAAHELIGYIIAGLVTMHISAALFHYFIRRDGVLQRMLP